MAASVAIGISPAQRPKNSVMRSSVTACIIPATGVRPPFLTLVAVRAMAPVAGIPPNSGPTMFVGGRGTTTGRRARRHHARPPTHGPRAPNPSAQRRGCDEVEWGAVGPPMRSEGGGDAPKGEADNLLHLVTTQAVRPHYPQ